MAEPRTDSARAWTIVAFGAVASGLTFGTLYTFGAFFGAMSDDFGSGRGATALVFGLTLLLAFGLGAVSGPLADRLGPQRLVIAGAVLIGAGLVLTSRVHSVSLGYLTYGVGVGLGAGLVITPMYVIAGGWFVRRRAVALGVVATGNGFGTLVLVPMAERLIDAHGWRTAYVVLASIDAAALAIVGMIVARPPIPPAPPVLARMREVAATKAFRWLFITGLLFAVSLFTAFAFIVDFATDAGVTSSRAALLVGIVGASSVVGRLGLTAIAGRLHAVRLLQICLGAQPVAFALWLAAGGSYPALVAFAVLLGIAYGGYVALSPEATAVIFGTAGLGGVMGLLFLSAGIGGLIGPPFSGWLADATDGRSAVIGVTLLVSTVAFLLSLAIPVRREPQPEIAVAATS